MPDPRSGMTLMPAGCIPGCEPGLIPIDRGYRLRQPWSMNVTRIIALALIVIVALTVLSLTVHFLFSPWLLVAIAILAWIRFRPRRSRQ